MIYSRNRNNKDRYIFVIFEGISDFWFCFNSCSVGGWVYVISCKDSGLGICIIIGGVIFCFGGIRWFSYFIISLGVRGSFCIIIGCVVGMR